MQFANYNFDDIKAAASCIDIARELGLKVSNDGRCAAEWRGGTNATSVSMNADGWHDFKVEESGSVIDLVAMVQYGGLIPQAQNWLGQRLGLTPTSLITEVRKGRYDMLLADGYREVCRYPYVAADGSLVQNVVRMEHPDKGKEFLQCDASGRWSIKHIQPVLYNLPAITESSWVIVVEGEKDANTLIEWGYPATTNAGGAKKWEDSFSDALAGKNIVLMPDNDEAGRAHLDLVGKSVNGKAKEIKVCTLSSLPKGDVTDWKEKEGGTPEAFSAALAKSEPWTEPDNELLALVTAKEANETPFCNYTTEKQMQGAKTKIVKNPRHTNAMIKDVHTRFMGFPCKIGSVMFDQDKDSRRIEYITSTANLFGWITEKSNQQVGWTRGDLFTNKEEFYGSLIRQSRRYESISRVPDWPRRDDVYYSHPALPAPSKDHHILEGLIDFFSPASPAYRTLLKALFCAPIFFRKGIPRPMWVIDSEDGAGCGKTTIAEAVAELYDAPPIDAGKGNLRYGMDDLVKRMVSSSGRIARVFLLDNITGSFASEELAGLVTKSVITGKAPYGKDEESRPNNLTYIVTANSASLDNDLAVRSFFIFVRRPDKMDPTWKQRLMDYVRVHRLQVFADYGDLLSNHEPFDIGQRTRFPEFERSILQPQCKSVEELEAVLNELTRVRDDSNREDEMGQQIEETIRDYLIGMKIEGPYHTKIFIRSNVIEEWLRPIFPNHKGSVVQMIRNLSKNGLLDVVDPKIQRYPHHGKNRRAGVMWAPKNASIGPWVVGGTGKNPKQVTA